MSSRIIKRGLGLLAATLLMVVVVGCGESRPEGNMPKTQPLTEAQIKEQIDKVNAGAAGGLGKGVPGIPQK